MTQNALTPAKDDLTPSRKPRVMIAGEFSAGKTCLISGLLGEQVLPSNVTATALPPVWLVSGEKRFAVVDLKGVSRDVENFDDVVLEDTQYCVVSHPAEILKRFDIIDTPGSSDPNIPVESWERMLNYVDFALWCTNATQAWRQSEKAVWDELPEHLVGPAMLLVTHADRMADDRTADRVLRRVRREGKKYFSHYLMGSLIRPNDIMRISDQLEQIVADGIEAKGENNSALDRLLKRWSESAPAPKIEDPNTPRVQPRRVRPSSMVMDDEELEGAEQTGEVLPLTKGAAELENQPDVSRVRTAWNEISDGLDTTDPEAIMSCVERFVLLLEDNGALYLDSSDDVLTSSLDADDDVSQARMNGRQA